MRPLHTKATRRRRCSMTSEKAAVDASRLRKPQFLHARIALRGQEGDCFSSRVRGFHCALLAYPCSAAARQWSIDSRLNRQSLPTLKAGICPFFSMR